MPRIPLRVRLLPRHTVSVRSVCGSTGPLYPYPLAFFRRRRRYSRRCLLDAAISFAIEHSVEQVTAQLQRSRRSGGIGSPQIRQSMTDIATPYTLHPTVGVAVMAEGLVASSNPCQLDGTPPTRNPPMFRAAGHVYQGDVPLLLLSAGSGSVSLELLAKVHG